MTDKAALKAAALDLIGRGWAIFPVGGQDGKQPLVKWSRAHTRRENEVNVWLHRFAVSGWGVVTGRASGVVVVDIDGDYIPPEVEATPTYTVQTPRGGWHFYYACTDKVSNSAGKLGDKVDVRGDGGYVVAAGSYRPDGQQYVYTGGEPAQWPFPPEEPKAAVRMALVRSQGGLTVSDRLRKAENYAYRCHPSVSGSGGHNQALKVARAMVQGFGLSAEEAMAAMQRWNKRCQPPWTEKELEHKIASAIDTPDPAHRPQGYLLEESQEVVVVDDIEPERPKPLPPPSDPDADDEEREELCARLAEQGDIAKQFITFVRGKSRIWQPGITTGAALALGATLNGRRYHWEGVTSHIYCLGVAPSATGKDVPAKALAGCLGDMVISGMPSVKAIQEAVRTACDAGTGACLINGEMAKLLRQLLGARTPAYLALGAQFLLELGTWGADDMRIERAVGDQADGRQLVLRAPCLSIFGTATPEDILDVLGEASLRDGLLGRFLFFRSQAKLPDKGRPSARGNPALDAYLRDWHRARQFWVSNSNTLTVPSPEELPATDGQTLADYDQEIHRARQIGDSVLPDELLGRQAEHAQRVAIAIAGLRSEPRVTADAEALAVRIVERCASDLWSLASRHSASSPWERGLKRVLEAATLAAGVNGYCQKRDILKSVRERDVEAWIAALVAEGSLQARETKARNGREVTVYRALTRRI